MKKIIAIYLPQYHEIEENNKWWGEGHTEWVSCKKSKPLFKNHYQPRVPLNKNYYDLTNQEEQIRQAQVAKKYGVYGFCYYHYWFEGKQIMQKPMEQMLRNKNIDMPFCVSWANHTWTNSTSRKNRKILIKQTYGTELDWKNHFDYLKQFFNDKRYIKIGNKPMMVIYDAKDIECWEQMKMLWDSLAKNEGWDGLFYVNTLKHEDDVAISNKYKFDAQFEYQPTFALGKSRKFDYSKWYNFKRVLYKEYLDRPLICDYDRVWKRILSQNLNNRITTYLGAYNDWDTTARWGKKGIIHKGSSPEKFERYLQKLIEKSNSYSGSEFIFVTAWNEWSEGAYLEADEKYGYKYLEAISRVVNSK
ncbi:glycosyltransferase WbsX family protein [Clostridium sp. 'White wine YQ']|uniref:glycosyltransferase WbsX family protein n=1 Tax=Clostridium sp. 'White wine YQ' TaxID=3027474 RepID=UPI0023664718|nr:glycoside hydrolase family 99-like domain-containing protein [Clostridium sp. 'White wine YQ']MDD7792774.1 glycoside hydrolase family 99-like domain-containing protein [Clostridium sp. 'White wine YQ']